MRLIGLLARAGFVLAFATLIGCGSKGPKVYGFNPVKGRVVRDNQPIKGGGTIEFSPADDPNILVHGKIEDDGTFTLMTNMTKPAKDDIPGAPDGTYNVSVRLATGQRDATSIMLPETQIIKPGDNDIIVKLPSLKK
jgi:hypothetical protein